MKTKEQQPSEVEQHIKAVVDNFRVALGEAKLAAISAGSGTSYSDANSVKGNQSGLTNDLLAQVSGVGRSTIARYLGESDSNGSKEKNTPPINPDLENICRLAYALRVPPALLLMRSDDWKRLMQGFEMYQHAINKERFRMLVSDYTNVDKIVFGNMTANQQKKARARERTKIALRIAKTVGALNTGDNDPRLERGVSSAFAVIKGTDELNENLLPVALCIASFMGISAITKPEAHS